VRDVAESIWRALSSAALPSAVWIGVVAWIGKQLGEFLHRRREERAPIGRILADLLEIRHSIISLEHAMSLIKKDLPLPAEAEIALKTIMMSLLPAPERLAARYEEALIQIAATRPVVAFRLRSQDLATPLLHTLRSAATSDQGAARIWSRLEPEFIAALQKHLDSLVVEVARLHGWKTWWDVSRGVRKGVDVGPDVARLVKKVTTEARALMDEVIQQHKKAHADLRAIASAISLYAAHMATLPPTLAALTTSTENTAGVRSDPFLTSLPSVPVGWSGYSYAPKPDGSFTLTATGDGMTVTVP